MSFFNSKMRKPGVLAIALLAILLIAGCSNSSKENNSNPTVITTTDFYGEVAKAVVGDKGHVTSVINKSSVDPHDYEPTTKVAKQVSSANFIVANGLGYDSWMNKLAKNSKSAKYIKVGENVMDKKTGDNPHIWYQPTTMSKYATYLANQLGKKYPKNKDYYQKNATKYIKSLSSVNDKLDQLKSIAASSDTKNVYVSEPVFDYAIEAMGFKVANTDFENAVEKETDPSPKSIKAMQNGIKSHDIKFFVYNKQVDSKTVNNLVKLARKNDIPVLKVTETLPNGKNYRQWMTSQYDELIKILNQD